MCFLFLISIVKDLGVVLLSFVVDFGFHFRRIKISCRSQWKFWFSSCKSFETSSVLELSLF